MICYFAVNMLLHLVVRLLRAGFEIARLHPLWACTALLLITLGAVLLVLRFASMARLRALSEHLFQIACGLLFFFLFLDFVNEALAPAPRAEALVALGIFLLILALGVQYGKELFARLKKLGLLELFEEKAPELIERLREVLEPMNVEIAMALGTPGTPLSPQGEYIYQNVGALIRYVEISGAAPTSEKNKKRYGDLLFKFGQLALNREDWWVAKRTLEKLQSLLGEDFEGFKVAYNLGMACYQCAKTSANATGLRRQALACFAEAARRDPFDADSFFWLAFVQDDLGMCDLAIDNNRKVLERRRGFAPAKYNVVISLIKKGQLEQALAGLLDIRPQDEEGLETLEFAPADEEIRPLLSDPIYGNRARWWLDSHQDPTRLQA